MGRPREGGRHQDKGGNMGEMRVPRENGGGVGGLKEGGAGEGEGDQETVRGLERDGET